MADMRAVVVAEGGGGPEVLSVGTVPRPVPTDGQVLVAVKATALNRADTLQRKGAYPPPPGASEIIGLECAGIIDSVGPGVTGWKVGDEVLALLPGGGYAEYAVVNAGHLIPKPKDMPFTTAGAIPEAWLTAFQLLHFVGEVHKDDFVLVHAAGSGVGNALVQLATTAGAKVIATAGQPCKLEKAKELGAIAGFDRRGKWHEQVMEATGGKGVQLVLDPVGGSYWEQNVHVLSLDSIWVLYGLMGGASAEGAFLRAILKKRIQLRGTTLRTRSDDYKTRLVTSFREKAMPHFESGEYKLHIDRVLPLEKVAEAHTVMDGNQNTGKIVLSVHDQQHAEL